MIRHQTLAQLSQFAPQTNAHVIEDILGWDRDPELHDLRANLLAHEDRKTFLNVYAEALVARHLRARGCALRFEVPTPAGKHCDFEVRRDDETFYLHVKRVDTGRPVRSTLTVSSRLRVLERINRPYVVQVRWREDLNGEQMQRFVTEASRFITRGRVGDEATIRERGGEELGGVRIVAPWEGPHVIVVIGLAEGFIHEAPRIRKLMRKAYRQFMPKATNIVLICTSHADDFEDFETALLGTHIERWDQFPQRGRRVAHGRDTDGFWYNGRFSESAAMGWFWFTAADSSLRCRLWMRENAMLPPATEHLLRDLFNTAPQVEA